MIHVDASKFRSRMNTILSEVKTREKAVLEGAGVDLIMASRPKTPLLTGQLMDNIIVEYMGMGVAEVSASAKSPKGYDYAAIQHEAHHFRHPIQGQSHYLREPATDWLAPRFAGRVATILRGV